MKRVESKIAEVILEVFVVVLKILFNSRKPWGSGNGFRRPQR